MLQSWGPILSVGLCTAGQLTLLILLLISMITLARRFQVCSAYYKTYGSLPGWAGPNEEADDVGGSGAYAPAPAATEGRQTRAASTSKRTAARTRPSMCSERGPSSSAIPTHKIPKNTKSGTRARVTTLTDQRYLLLFLQ